MATMSIITAPAAVREHLAGESPEVIQYAETVAYYHYDSLTPHVRGPEPLSISRDEWRMRYAVSQYETAIQRAKQDRAKREHAESLAQQEPPTGRWAGYPQPELTPRQAQYVRDEGGTATVSGWGLVREHGGEWQRWVTYTAAEKESIVRQRSEDAVSARIAAEAAEQHAASLLTPEIADWIAARDDRRGKIDRLKGELQMIVAQLIDDDKNRGIHQRVVASYVRSYGTEDQSRWHDHIREFVANSAASLMPPEVRDTKQAQARELCVGIRDMGAARELHSDPFLGGKARRAIYLSE